ncbi:MAG: hypothetical protein PHV82_01990 [Victivallaceae bacterium]|nr:hypothetical protein [Victivallaceae bacterium]
MKNFLLIILCCGATVCFSADDAKADLDKKEKDLQKQEKQLLREMLELRIKLIQKDPSLKKLHAKIMELHRELALSLDSKKEMREIADKLKKVRTSLAEISQQKDTDKKDSDIFGL